MSVLLAALVAIVVASTTSVAVAQPAVGDAFGAGPAEVGWIVFGYSAAFAVATIVYAQVGPRFGIGRVLAAGVLLLSAGSLLAVLAPNLPLLVLARMVGGAGAGAIPTLTIAVVADRLSGPARARAIGLNAAGVGVGNVLGPLAGGLLLEVSGWRGAMALGLIAAPAAAIVWRWVPDLGDGSAPVDRVGLVSLAGIAGGAVLVLNRVPVDGLSVAVILGLLAIAIGWVALRGWVRSGRSTILPALLLTDRELRWAVATGALTMTAFLGTLVTVPPSLAVAHGIDGVVLGLVFVPMAIGAAGTSLSWRRIVPAGVPTATMLAAAAIVAALVGLAVLGADAPLGAQALALGVLGTGFGLLQAPLISDIAARFDGSLRSLAVGLFNVGFFLGGAAGGAVGSALLGGAIEIGPFIDPTVPGFRTVMLSLTVGPVLALVGLASAGHRPFRSSVRA